MTHYAIYVWPCYAVAFVLLGGMLLSTLLEWHAAVKRMRGFAMQSSCKHASKY